MEPHRAAADHLLVLGLHDAAQKRDTGLKRGARFLRAEAGRIEVSARAAEDCVVDGVLHFQVQVAHRRNGHPTSLREAAQ